MRSPGPGVRSAGRAASPSGSDPEEEPGKGLLSDDLIDEIANDPDFNLCMNFEPGDMQFVKNATILHSCNAFEDVDDVEQRRHLLRLWLTLYRSAPDGQGRGGIPATRPTSV